MIRNMIRRASYPAKLNHEDVARCAYSLYENRGRQPGHDLDDWLEAEAQLLGAVAPEDDEPQMETVTAISPSRYGPPPAARRKGPLDERDHPFARDERGSASREEIRRQAVVTAPRQSQRPHAKSR